MATEGRQQSDILSNKWKLYYRYTIRYDADANFTCKRGRPVGGSPCRHNRSLPAAIATRLTATVSSPPARQPCQPALPDAEHRLSGGE